MSGTSISWLQIAASILCTHEQTQEYILASLWDGSYYICLNLLFHLLSLIYIYFMSKAILYEYLRFYDVSSIVVMHQRSSVRCATAMLFGSIIAHVSDRLANAKIVPAIVTFSNDPDV
jgi:hypothetical protein